MSVLKLVLTKQWFDMIASGEKKEEYREITDRYTSRLMYFDWVSANNYKPFKKYVGFKKFDSVEFIHGYRKDSRRITLECLYIREAKGQTKWGAEQDKLYFVIGLGRIMNQNF